MTQTGPFRVLEADPPWMFDNAYRAHGRSAQSHYQCLDLDGIKNFSLPSMETDSVLLLWRVAAMPRQALDVMDAWGFSYRTEIVWDKITATGKPHFGMGHYVRASHEVCLIGIRGRWKPEHRSLRSRFDGVVRAHSQKPDEFYDLVEGWARGPRIRLFARDHRPGWVSMGDELPDQDCLTGTL